MFIDHTNANMANRNNGSANSQSERFPFAAPKPGLRSQLEVFLFSWWGQNQVFPLDRSPVIGFIQIAVMLVGLGLICLGGYECLFGLWHGNRLSIAAEMGVRLISTGYVIAIFGSADIIGLEHPTPEFIPYWEWQARGIQIAEGFIAIGMSSMLPITENLFFAASHHQKTKQRSDLRGISNISFHHPIPIRDKINLHTSHRKYIT